MKIYKTKLQGVFKIKLFPFKDFRGKYLEIFNKKIFNKINRNIEFIQDDVSISKKNVFRGIHGDTKTWKLISCLLGKFYLVVVNNNKKSKEYLKYQKFLLTEKNCLQILIPPNFGNGHLVLSKKTIFHYKQSTYYNKKSQFTLKWNDPTLKIKWPKNLNPILSKRDK
jgi:dTDP-4-dehydrorhamnose 3,5-epimerase